MRKISDDGKDGEAAAVWVKLSSLAPWEDNPRSNDAAVEHVAASIRRFGFASPIIAREADGMVIAGHTRLKAAQSLGLDRVPVRYVALDPVDARLLALADNRIGELADWSDDLHSVLADLRAEDADIAGLGWDEDELAELLCDDVPDLEVGGGEARDDDAVPDVVEPTVKPGDVIEIGDHVLHCGDCISVLRTLAPESVDAIVTDPPYGLGFMSKAWDVSVPGEEWARECLRVLKPGGHLVAFGGTRTVHRLAVAIEDAGFEIRDQVHWCYWSGFPKSLDVSKAIDKAAGHWRGGAGEVKAENGAMGGPNYERTDKGDPVTDAARQWSGWGTALRPAVEPAVLARKPFPGSTVAECVREHDTGAINIDGCRMAYGDKAWPGPQGEVGPRGEVEQHPAGRWPANLYHCPKPAKSEREEGCDELAEGYKRNALTTHNGAGNHRSIDQGPLSVVRNTHPTVKPVALMRWLVRLVTPPGGLVVEPFAGSGTTMVACEHEDFRCVGIEAEPAYCDIIRARVERAVADRERAIADAG